MATPAAYNQNAVQQRGYTRLLLGTEPFAANLGYIVVSARASQRVTEIDTEQGTGLTAVVTHLIDGQNFEITVEEDLNIAPVSVGNLVTLQNVFGGALGNSIAPYGSTAVANGVFEVVDNNLQSTRKEIGQRVYACKAFALINGVTGGGNPTITVATAN